MHKIGMGYDVHQLVAGRKLVLGGHEIPYEKGLDGHSDADVLLHAICDAILGALGKGDIGEHFPNTDPQYKGISSLKLLREVYEIARGEGFKIQNVDSVIIAQEPNIKQYKRAMRENISRELGISATAVNIKATTNEGLGFAGRKEGIAAQAVVLLVPSPGG